MALACLQPVRRILRAARLAAKIGMNGAPHQQSAAPLPSVAPRIYIN